MEATCGQRVARASAVTRVLRKADLVVAKSQSMRSAVLELGVAPKRVCVHRQRHRPGDVHLPSGARITRGTAYGLPREAVVFVSVGRQIIRSRLPDGRQSIALARRGNPDLHYVVRRARRPPLCASSHDSWDRRCRSLWSAAAASTRSCAYWARDVFVNSSLFGGSPNFHLEALASGLPCVITTHRANRDVDAPGALTVGRHGGPGGARPGLRPSGWRLSTARHRW